MSFPVPPLPRGYRATFLDEIDSTNSEAQRRAARGDAGNLWIHARVQTAGRGREQRHWESAQGNLFASLLLRPGCPLPTRPQLAFVAGLALFDAADALAGDRLRHRLRLKWPNDLLLDGAKLGGILIESAGAADPGQDAVVIGTGLNLSSHPEQTLLAATCLAAHDVVATPEQAFSQLAHFTAGWLELWSEGGGWAEVRECWTSKALPDRSPIGVGTGPDRQEGYYGGIDEDGALILHTEGGATRRIVAGDVFPL